MVDNGFDKPVVGLTSFFLHAGLGVRLNDVDHVLSFFDSEVDELSPIGLGD